MTIISISSPCIEFQVSIREFLTLFKISFSIIIVLKDIVTVIGKIC